MVARTIRSGQSRAVEHKCDRCSMHCCIEQNLVKCSVDEGGVHRDDGVETSGRHPNRTGDCMLLGNANVERTCGVGAAECVEACGRQHRGGNRDDVLIRCPRFDKFVAEN